MTWWAMRRYSIVITSAGNGQLEGLAMGDGGAAGTSRMEETLRIAALPAVQARVWIYIKQSLVEDEKGSGEEMLNASTCTGPKLRRC